MPVLQLQWQNASCPHVLQQDNLDPKELCVSRNVLSDTLLTEIISSYHVEIDVRLRSRTCCVLIYNADSACRDHTDKVSASHIAAGGKEWDTIKPLHKWFKHLHRVLLMDDDAYKVSTVVPCAEGSPSQTLFCTFSIVELTLIYSSSFI